MRRFFKVLLEIGLLGLVWSAVSVTLYASTQSMPSKEEADGATRERVLQTYGNLPLYFIENTGQLDEQVRYYTKTPGQTIYFTDEKIVFGLSRKKSTVHSP